MSFFSKKLANRLQQKFEFSRFFNKQLKKVSAKSYHMKTDLGFKCSGWLKKLEQPVRML